MGRVVKTIANKGFRLEIKGFNETLRNLELTKDQRTNLQKFLVAEANKVVTTAKKICPEDTGRLKDSHRVLTYGAKGKGSIRADVVVGGISVRGRFVNYAAAVHGGYKHFYFGRYLGKKPGRPWLANALKTCARGFESRLRRAIKIHGKKG